MRFNCHKLAPPSSDCLEETISDERSHCRFYDDLQNEVRLDRQTFMIDEPATWSGDGAAQTRTLAAGRARCWSSMTVTMYARRNHGRLTASVRRASKGFTKTAPNVKAAAEGFVPSH